MTRTHRFAVASAAVMLAVGTGVSAENWPQWRGPGGQGISNETQLPLEWAPDRNIAWKTELPSGHSSPIVWGDRIFLTAAIEGEVVPGAKAVPHTQGGQPFVHPDSVSADRKQTLQVIALDAKTGRQVWERVAYEGTVYDARHRRSSFAGPTAATDGQMVYAYFGPEGLYAYDFSGKLAWKVVEHFATLGLGTGTSPVLFQNLVIIQRDEDNGDNSVVVAYDRKTGQGGLEDEARRRNQLGHARARARGGSHRARDQRQLRDRGLRPGDGEGAVADERRREQRHSHAAHQQGAGDRDRGLSGEENHRDPARARAPAGTRVAWEYAKGTGYVLSNIAYGDYLYLLTDNGVVTCLDAATGAVKYEGGRPPVPTHFMGSPVAFSGMIAMTSEDGETFLIKAGPDARDRPHEFGRRAGLFVARDRQRPHLHPRREAPLRDRRTDRSPPVTRRARAAGTLRTARARRTAAAAGCPPTGSSRTSANPGTHRAD